MGDCSRAGAGQSQSYAVRDALLRADRVAFRARGMRQRALRRGRAQGWDRVSARSRGRAR